MSRRHRPTSHHKKEPVAHGEFIMGRNCIEEVVSLAPERILEVFVAESRDENRAGARSERKGDLFGQLVRLRVPVREVSRRELDALVASESHQGFVARVRERRYLQLEELVEMVRERSFISILALDGVLDPQNFGAILRAAECFGVDAVVWSKNRGAPLGPVVSKVSVGASEIVPLCPVSNLHRALEALKEAGAWLSGAIISSDAQPLDRFEFPEKSVVVVGAEGEGIHQLTDKSLDFRVFIPMSGRIDSLNVSQATAVMLQEVAKQHRQKRGLKVT